MRIATLVTVLLVSVSATFAAGPLKFTPGITKLTTETGATTLQDSETGRLRFVSGRLSGPVADGQEIEATVRFLNENKSAYLMKDPAQEVLAQRIDVDPLGMRHVRLDQQYQGLPVYGGGLIAHFSKDNALTAINGTYVEGIEIDTDPQVTSDQAVQRASSDLQSFFGAGEPNRPELIVFPWEGNTYIAWRMELFSDTPMGRWEYFVDAKTGEVIFKANRIMDVDAIGTGTGVMGSARTHIDTDYNGSQYRMIDNTRQAANNPHGHDGQMPPGNIISTYVAGASLPGTLAIDADNVWDASAQASSVDAQVYTALVYDWWLSALGRNSFDDAGASMRASVDYYAEGNNNAYWNGAQMVIWSWGSGWRSLAGCPDVIAHEWGHAVTGYTSNLVYQKESGALNESFSDMMGAAFEFAHSDYDTPDWYVGENGQISGGYFRDMSNPPARSDPDYYGGTYWVNVTSCTPTDANDYCGVHTNSGVGNKWFYLLSVGGTHHSVTVTGIGIDHAMEIAYRANTFYWTDFSTYSEAAYGTVLAARDLDPSGVWETQVRNGWAAVGVAMPSPYLTFSYPNGKPSLLTPGQPATFEVMVSATYDGSVVSGSGNLYYNISSGQSGGIAMTELGPGHFQATLPAIGCGQTIEYSVEAYESTTGQFLDPSPPNSYLAEPGTDQTVVFEDDFETNKGWAPGTGWARGTPLGGGGEYGGPDPSSAYSGTNVYGFNLAGDYDNDMTARHLTSPAFNCTGLNNVHIDFQRWLGVEQPAYDHASIRVSTNGTTWTTVWENPTEIADQAWTPMDVNISAVASGQATVYVRFTMGTTDGGWRFCGWNIDDFRVTAYQCNLAADIDGDGVPDDSDNCLTTPNSSQSDTDGDTFGDACDICAGFDDAVDTDGDAVPDGCDLCAGFDDAADADGDSVPDGCDQCAGHNDLADADSDTVPDGCDNCVDRGNPGQEDTDGNGSGDACCCQLRVGDVNQDGTDEPSLGDIMTTVDFLFISGNPLGCVLEADIDQSGGASPATEDITMGDIMMLVDYLFLTGPEVGLPDCL